jgi:hypothetical protein
VPDKPTLGFWLQLVVAGMAATLPVIIMLLLSFGEVRGKQQRVLEELAQLHRAQLALEQEIQVKADRQELRDLVDELNQRLVDLRADLRAHNAHTSRAGR